MTKTIVSAEEALLDAAEHLLVDVEAGDTLIVLTPGGGGYGRM